LPKHSLKVIFRRIDMEKEELLRRWGKELTGDKCGYCGTNLLGIPPFDGICPNCDDYNDW